MVIGQRLLVIEKGRDGIKEWNVHEIGKTAVKVQNMVEATERFFLIGTDTTKPFWVLLTDIDKLGQTKYQIIEEL